MSIAALVRALASAGATPEAIAIAVEAVEAAGAADTKRRADAAERKRRSRANAVTVTGQSQDKSGTVTATLPDKEKSPRTPLKEINPPASSLRSDAVSPATEKPPSTSKRVDCSSELVDRGVDRQVVEDWKQVRKAKDAGPITKTVIDALVREASKAGVSVEDAIRTCCERGWQGFKADWVLRQQQARAGPGRRDGYTTFAQVAEDLDNAIRDKDRFNNGPTFDGARVPAG